MRAKSAADKTNKDPGTDKGPKTEPRRWPGTGKTDKETERDGEEGRQRENVAEKCLSKEKKEEIVERNKKKIKVYVAHVSQEEEGADTAEGGKERGAETSVRPGA